MVIAVTEAVVAATALHVVGQLCGRLMIVPNVWTRRIASSYPTADILFWLGVGMTLAAKPVGAVVYVIASPRFSWLGAVVVLAAMFAIDQALARAAIERSPRTAWLFAGVIILARGVAGV